MEFLSYIRRFLGDALNKLSVWVLGPIWGYLTEFWLSDQFWSSPSVWLTIFWTGTYILGSIMAIMDPNDKWEPRKSLQAVLRLLVGLVCVGAAAGLRNSHVTGGWLPSGILDTAMVFTEFAYLMKTLGRLTHLAGNHTQGDMLEMVSNVAEEYLHTKTTTTVSVGEPNADGSKPPTITVEEKIVTVTSNRPIGCLGTEDNCPALALWDSKKKKKGKTADDSANAPGTKDSAPGGAIG